MSIPEDPAFSTGGRPIFKCKYLCIGSTYSRNQNRFRIYNLSSINSDLTLGYQKSELKVIEIRKLADPRYYKRGLPVPFNLSVFHKNWSFSVSFSVLIANFLKKNTKYAKKTGKRYCYARFERVRLKERIYACSNFLLLRAIWKIW